MEDTKLYGNLKSEKLVEESIRAHQIVSEIGNFGINDRQRWLVIYYLALELENIDKMQELTSCIKELNGNDLFVSKIFSNETEA
jgi:hypothetical protein